jgi:hypothetical protein
MEGADPTSDHKLVTRTQNILDAGQIFIIDGNKKVFRAGIILELDGH